MARWKRSDLEKEMTWEEFQEELEHLYAWMSRHKRPLGSWLDAVRRWSTGDH